MKNEKTGKVLKDVADLKMLPKGFRFNREDVWDKINSDLNEKKKPRKIFTFKKFEWRECLNWAAIVIFIMVLGYFILSGRENSYLSGYDLPTKYPSNLINVSSKRDVPVMDRGIFETKDTGTFFTLRRVDNAKWFNNIWGSLTPVNSKVLLSKSMVLNSKAFYYSRIYFKELLPDTLQDRSPQFGVDRVDLAGSLRPEIDQFDLCNSKRDSTDLAVSAKSDGSNYVIDDMLDDSFLNEGVKDVNIQSYSLKNGESNYFQTANYSAAPNNIHFVSFNHWQPWGLVNANSLLAEQIWEDDLLMTGNFWDATKWEIERDQLSDFATDEIRDIRCCQGTKPLYHSMLKDIRGKRIEGETITDSVTEDKMMREIVSFSPNSNDLMKDGIDALKSLCNHLCVYPHCKVELIAPPAIDQNQQMINRNRLRKLFDLIMKMQCANKNLLTIQISKGESKDNEVQIYVGARNRTKDF